MSSAALRTPNSLTRQQAETELRRRRANETPQAWRGERLTVAELGQRDVSCLEGPAKMRKPTTLLHVAIPLRVHLVPYFGEKPIDRITERDVEQLIAKLHAQGLSSKSIRNYAGALTAMLSFAVKRKWLARNVASGAELPPKEDYNDIRFLSPDDVQLLVAAALAGEHHEVDRALYLTAAHTELRQGELIALRWRDVDWATSTIRVRQNYVRGISARRSPRARCAACRWPTWWRASWTGSTRLRPPRPTTIWCSPTPAPDPTGRPASWSPTWSGQRSCGASSTRSGPRGSRSEDFTICAISSARRAQGHPDPRASGVDGPPRRPDHPYLR
jgi:hypothetical protein